MARIFNFGAGPAMLPEPVLRQAAEEMLDWHGSGMSVMEVSHRGKEFIAVHANAEADLRELLAIPKNYKVLFLQGGGAGQFSFVPMNLLRGRGCADYVQTGYWSKKAIAEAKRYCRVNLVANTEDSKFTRVPKLAEWKLDPGAAYVHITSNETIEGVEYHWIPDTNGVPLVTDASSHILSRPLDVSRFGLIYAGAQKNVGPAGLTIVIVRDDLIGHAMPATPSVFDYKVQADADSMHNTPPSFSLYVSGLVFRWLKKLGGLRKMEQINIAKAKVIYDYLDQTEFYHTPVVKEDRSRMNVQFRLRNEQLDAEFLKQAESNGLSQLKGHRAIGGMRASIYNAMPTEGVKALVDFMREFERKHG
ncbi:MAG: 3-phosphoserine/phosphohydroxythreonine transaminase [Betaproteobacteria bacterium]|nr:3-phosphoserine/phosphohydroxythreonine transaminase [Betaproteobacteria bacterium]